jgi:hypothetical protein
MRVAEKLDWKGLKMKKSVGNRKIIIGSERVNNMEYSEYTLLLTTWRCARAAKIVTSKISHP